jgi:hypothetical protein
MNDTELIDEFILSLTASAGRFELDDSEETEDKVSLLIEESGTIIGYVAARLGVMPVDLMRVASERDDFDAWINPEPRPCANPTELHDCAERTCERVRTAVGPDTIAYLAAKRTAKARASIRLVDPDA